MFVINNDVKFEEISDRLQKLRSTIGADRSHVSCLRRWSEFIRERDGHRCVDCHSREKLSAHHICRKTFSTAAQYDTGNGITLCRNCHKEVHAGYNGRPKMSLPVDAQGGEKLAIMERLYSILLDDAVERGLMCEDFYYLGNEILEFFKRMQGYDVAPYFPGSRLEQAYLILAEPERKMRQAIAEANGFKLHDNPMLPDGMTIIFGDGDGRQSGEALIQGYSQRTPDQKQANSDD